MGLVKALFNEADFFILGQQSSGIPLGSHSKKGKRDRRAENRSFAVLKDFVAERRRGWESKRLLIV